MTLLNINTISGIAQKVLPKDFNFEIHKSETSESVYLKINYSDMDTSLRFSDHHTTKSKIKTVIIKETTKVSLIERTILRTANELKKLSLSLKLGITCDKTKNNK